MEPVETLVKRAHLELQLTNPSHPDLRFIRIVNGNLVWPDEHWKDYQDRFAKEDGKPLEYNEELGKYHRALRTALRESLKSQPS
jgi:hypothetical protein